MIDKSSMTNSINKKTIVRTINNKEKSVLILNDLN